ncbi:hypothetical protein [Nitrosomonas sp.]|uniref:hypothetical protein n=1 Tax=Nitrosomonas sp. TaxID=42353 RepID=UPI0025ED1BFF|nr:hypothetical protein [Nitrosomonas sp.]MBY0484448.1 hypothetical protein [Nitrosomonas sp.]
MNEFVAVIGGLFTLVAAFFAWKLKTASDDATRKLAIEKERRDEIKLLYENTFILFEQAIRQVKQREQFSLGCEFSQTNAKMHLVAPKPIADQYLVAASLLEDWSQLHAKASPRQIDIGGQTATLIQSPDPTAPFKEPEKKAHESLLVELQKLTQLMREDLAAYA